MEDKGKLRTFWEPERRATWPFLLPKDLPFLEDIRGATDQTVTCPGMKGYRGSLCKTGLGIRSSLAPGTHACNAARPLQTKWPWDGNRSSPSLVRVRPRTPDAEVRQRLAKRLVHTQCLSMNGACTSQPRCRACGAPAGAQRGAGRWHVENHIAGEGGCAHLLGASHKLHLPYSPPHS